MISIEQAELLATRVKQLLKERKQYERLKSNAPDYTQCTPKQADKYEAKLTDLAISIRRMENTLNDVHGVVFDAGIGRVKK